MQFNDNNALIMSVAYARNYYFNSQYMEEVSEQVGLAYA